MEITIHLRKGIDIDVDSIIEIDEYALNVEYYSPPESRTVKSAPITELQMRTLREIHTALSVYQIDSGLAQRQSDTSHN